MAYFFNHIKGLTENNGTQCLTYIKWSNTAATESLSVNAVPTITNSGIEYGHIITQNAKDQQVDYLSVNNFTAANFHIGDSTEIIYSSNAQQIQYGGKILLNELTTNQLTVNDFLKFSGDNIILRNDNSGGTITATGKIEGLYFNATSDRRVKTNIRPIAYGALNIVMNTPIYTFNYIKDNVESCGIMAQDLPEDYSFDFIDRSNPDLLKVHESKLVYLLWKALQEQQLEIRQLKDELKELKNN